MSAGETVAPSQQDTLRTRWRALPQLLALLWQVGQRDVLVLLALSLATGLMPLMVVLVLRQLIDSGVGLVQGTATFSTAVLWLGMLLLATLLQDGLGVTGEWLGDDIQERLKLQVQGQVLAKASSLTLADFEQPDAYDQLHRAQQGLDTRLFTTMQQLVPVPGLVVTALSLLIFLGTASPLFPLVLLAGVLPGAVVHVRFFGRKYALDRAQTAPKRMLEALTLLMAERPAAAEIRVLGLRDHLIARWGALFGALRGERLRLADRQALLSTTLEVTDKLTLGLVIAGCIALIALGRLSLGSFAAFLSAVSAFTNAVYLVFWNLTTTDSDLRYIRDVLDYLDRPAETGVAPTRPLSKVSTLLPEVCFQQVSFRYPGAQHPILVDIDLVLRPGERVALVGANGAGKTTLAKLLLGLYRPTAGRILVDGIDIKTLDPSIWRMRVAAVFQDFVRYELTANENIAFGDLEQWDDTLAIAEAARRAGADRVLAELPDGGTTMLGKAYDEHGADLSGGQWQRLAIARAYLRDADVLVLDEPTAALDARAEVEIYRQFRDAAQGRTTVLISHRLGSARLADRIIVLESGRIVESGTHAELLAQAGCYAQLYRAQAEWYR